MLDAQMTKKKDYVSHFTMHTYMYAHRHINTHIIFVF